MRVLAVLSSFVVIASSEPKCEVAARPYIENQEFYKGLSSCAMKFTESGIRSCLQEKFSKKIDSECLTCFSDAAHCGFMHCKLACIRNTCDESCVSCTEKNCFPATLSCNGFDSPDPSDERAILKTQCAKDLPEKMPADLAIRV
eukprot:GDKJ01004481.1.p2 GENE.GDKJ01004481.1~~GDKJ01004481.1.p2  ORF type:complete len:144 (-),score=40.02 GDKJ01004481.1:408-839(-)